MKKMPFEPLYKRCISLYLDKTINSDQLCLTEPFDLPVFENGKWQDMKLKIICHVGSRIQSDFVGMLDKLRFHPTSLIKLFIVILDIYGKCLETIEVSFDYNSIKKVHLGQVDYSSGNEIQYVEFIFEPKNVLANNCSSY